LFYTQLYTSLLFTACNLTKNCGGKIVYKWIPREQNTEADKLSKEAVNNKEV